jgi:hypothetical protein
MIRNRLVSAPSMLFVAWSSNVQRSARSGPLLQTRVGAALVAVGILLVVQGVRSWPDSDTPEPYKEWHQPATPLKRMLAITLGGILAVAGVWLIANNGYY